MPLSRSTLLATRWLLACVTLALFCGIACAQNAGADAKTPTLFLIGDSTVRNGAGDGANKQWGWGEPIAAYFDPAKIPVLNRARGGRSSRAFLTERRQRRRGIEGPQTGPACFFLFSEGGDGRGRA